jgi:hypothetical protein
MNAKKLTTLSAATLVALSATAWAPAHQAEPGAYSFTKVKQIGDPAPGGGTHFLDFEPGGLNDRGEAIYGTDIATLADPHVSIGEGVFLSQSGEELELARSGGTAPGGGTFNGQPLALLSDTALHDPGDAAFTFQLSPFNLPLGVNAGTFRYSHATRVLSSVVQPGVTVEPAGGGIFAGVGFGNSLNNAGELIFHGIIATDQGIHLPGEPYVGLGIGVFKADNHNHISSVAVPGDAAPGGGKFDWADAGWIEHPGDVAFLAHLAGEEASAPEFAPQAVTINTLGSLYVKDGHTGKITSIVHQGDPAPGGRVFRQVLQPVMNHRGEIAFPGDLSAPPDVWQVLGVYLYSAGATTAVAQPGDDMPGGGEFVTASSVGGGQVHLNNRGEVAFNAVLSTDTLGTGGLDTGLFVWSRGSLRLVARTGTVIPGMGTVAGLFTGANSIPPPPGSSPNSGAINNDRGQVLFTATFEDGTDALLVATPAP